jgi:GNAT superfamily N-acetyltransferase
MELELRQVTSLQEALRLAPRIEESAAAFQAQFSDAALPRDAAARLLATRFDAPQTVLIGAFPSGGGDPVGLCLVGPLEDPLTLERTPIVLVLQVDERARRRGVARALVEHAQSVLAARGMRVLAARAGHNDDALISMGERWGFVRAWELMLFE